VEPLTPLQAGHDYSRSALERGYDYQPDRSRTADVPFWTAPAGYCRWCGLDTEAVHRRTGQRNWQVRWHQACVSLYRQVMSQGAFRAAVRKRDRGVCATCPPGTPPHARWVADHIVPLWAGGEHHVRNGQTLCVPHEREKTRREAGDRAAVRRVARAS